eukprot:scaffold116783_cov63-Phaeocystis_antarctica.AAC.3
MQHRSNHDHGGDAFVGVDGVGVIGVIDVGVVGTVGVGVLVAVVAVHGVSGGGGGVNGGGGGGGVGVGCACGSDGVGAAGGVGVVGVGAACEAPAPHDGAAALPPSPMCAGGSLSAFRTFSASRTSLVAAPSSGCCSRSLASSGLTPRSGSASHSPRTASRRASDVQGSRMRWPAPRRLRSRQVV